MSASRPLSPFAPFAIRSFRFQWPADLATSWGFEMEALILGWYILTATDSVVMLTVLGALRFIGTLLSPLFGVAGDQLGRRRMIVSMRAFFALNATAITVLALLDMLTPTHVLVVAFLNGLVQPSDILMRNALLGDSIPGPMLMSATSVNRISQDSARIFGALAGAGLFALLGIGVSYLVVVSVYGIAVACSLGVSRAHPRRDHAEAQAASGTIVAPARANPYKDLKEGLVYIWNTPAVLAIVWLAFLANLTAFPVTHGLMPFVARDVLQVDENGLGQLLAAFSAGAVIGSVILALTRGQRHSARLMLIFIVAWYLMLLVFTQADGKAAAILILVLVGVAHSLGMVSMSVALLTTTDAMLRGRVMGVRVLAIYGVPLGLLFAGLLIDRVGYTSFVFIYAAIGIFFTAAIGVKWRQALWTPAN